MTKKASATTTNSAYTIPIDMVVEYVFDAELVRRMRRVVRTVDRWKRQCCGKKAGKRHCDNYGCQDLETLIAPLREIRVKKREKK